MSRPSSCWRPVIRRVPISTWCTRGWTALTSGQPASTIGPVVAKGACGWTSLLSEGLVDSPDLLSKVAKCACTAVGAVSGVAGIVRALRQRLLWQSVEIVALVAAIFLIVLHPGLGRGWYLRVLLLACVSPFTGRVVYEVARSKRGLSRTALEVDNLLGQASAPVQRLGVRIAGLLDHLKDSDGLTGPAVTDARTNVDSLFKLIGRPQPTSHLVDAIEALISDTETRIGSDQVGAAVVGLLRKMALMSGAGEDP